MLAEFQKVIISQEQSFFTDAVHLQQFIVPWHYHPEYELTFISKSHGTRFIGNHMQPFSSGDLILIGPNLPHFWKTAEDVISADAFVVQFLPEKIGAAFFSLPEMQSIQELFRKGDRGICFTGCAIIPAVEKYMKEIVHAENSNRIILLLQILNLLAAETQGVLLSGISYVPQVNKKSNERINRVYNFLMSEYTRHITLNEAAQIAHMTPEAFCRYFKKINGRSLREFLNQIRINYAGQQLLESRKSITEICFDSGFNTVTNFNRRFREIKQCTPREFRRMHSGTASVFLATDVDR